MQSEFSWNTPSLVVPAIEHVSLDPGRSTQLPLGGGLIVGVESGSVQLDLAGTDLDGNRRPAHEPLDTGNIRILEGKGELTLRNFAGDAAEVWVFTSDGSSPKNEPSGDVTNEPAPGLAIAFMPLMLSSELLGSSQHVSVTRITLPPGTTVVTHAPGVIEAVAVLDGALDVTVSLGRALKCTAGSIAQPFDDSETIAAGEGVSAKGSASLGYRVVGPQSATLLIMRIESAPGSRGSSESPT
jgi:quercetin dioxygenase-like cupin family protein